MCAYVNVLVRYMRVHVRMRMIHNIQAHEHTETHKMSPLIAFARYARMYEYTCVCIRLWTQYIHAYIMHMYVCTRTQKSIHHTCTQIAVTVTHTHTHTHQIQTYPYIHTYIHTCSHTSDSRTYFNLSRRMRLSIHGAIACVCASEGYLHAHTWLCIHMHVSIRIQ
jgi:hypothetical protein